MTAPTMEPEQVATESSDTGSALEVEGLWKIFGPRADKVM